MYIYQGGIPMSGGYSAYQWICEYLGLTPQYYQLVGTFECLHQILSTRILTPKGGGSFALDSLTNRSHHVDFISLHGPCFVFKILCKIKPGDQCWSYTYVISLPDLGIYFFGLGETPGSSVVWKFLVLWWSPTGDSVRGSFFNKLWCLWESYQMVSNAW